MVLCHVLWGKGKHSRAQHSRGAEKGVKGKGEVEGVTEYHAVHMKEFVERGAGNAKALEEGKSKVDSSH